MALTRRLAGLLVSFAALATVSWAAAALPVRAADLVGDKDIALGSPTAPVTLVEYASVSCPHCAHFAADVFPALKARYIDTGKVRYVFREAPIHPQEDTAGFLIARCAGPARYLAVTDALFHAQSILFDKNNLHGWLTAGAEAGGLSEAQMRACISDVSAIQTFNARADHTLDVDKIDSTPTVIVNGTRINPKGNAFTIADIDAAVQPLLGGKSGAVRRRPAQAPVH